jgi:predicted transcriptional regulator YdeE
METKIVERDAFTVVGIATRTSNQLEADPASAKIPGLWQRFFAEGITGRVTNARNNGTIFGVYTEYESDLSAPYTLFVGCETDGSGDAPGGLTQVNVPAQRYLVFTATGEIPQAVIDAWGYIWNYFENTVDYMRAYTTDFEMYHPSGTQVDIYVAVKE